MDVLTVKIEGVSDERKRELASVIYHALHHEGYVVELHSDGRRRAAPTRLPYGYRGMGRVILEGES